MPRTALLVLQSLLLTLLVAVPAQAAEEAYERPADGVFELEGRGWGHGRGMSQWGAQGAALQGRTADEITSFYYAGTARAVLPDSVIRVRLAGDEGRDTLVHAAEGLRVSDAATGRSADLPDGPTRWRVTAGGGRLSVAGLAGSAWQPLAGMQDLTGPVRFSGPTFTRVVFPDGSSRDYRGSVTAVGAGGSSLHTVVVLGLEDYLLGVVPREASSGWRPAALQAQAIAARSYSAYKRDRVQAGAPYDICDTTACQVFGGSRLYSSSGKVTELEPASTTEAVRATRGVVRTHEGRPVLAEFSSSNGGWSAAGHVPYLAAREDPWDGHEANPQHAWKASLPVRVLEKRWPAVGTLQRLRVTARTGHGAWGGRIRTVVLEGTGGSVTVTGDQVRSTLPWPSPSTGIRSTWWRVVASTGSEVVQQSVAPRLVRPPGASTGEVSVAVRNTGATSWTTRGLHLAVSSPPGQADAITPGRSTRPGAFVGNRTRPGATTVAPGEVATFRVALDAAGVADGTHRRVYRLRVDDGPLFGGAVSWRFPVDAALFTATRAAVPSGPTAQGSGDAPPPVSADGRTVVVPRTGSSTVRLAARNTGNVTWPVGGAVTLGTSGARDRASASVSPAWLSPKRAARLQAPEPVQPGSTGTFVLELAGNGRPVGITREAFEPVWDGRHWIDGAVTSLAVVRTDPDVSRLAMLHSAPRGLRLARTGKGSTATLVLRLRNLGGSPWAVGKEPVSSGTAAPLRTSAWTGPTRPPALAANASRPGVRSVHPGEIGEWRVPLSAAGRKAGRYTLTLRAVGPGGVYGPAVTTTITVA